MTEGVITGCDEKQEWMLKTWWDYYLKSNSYPVTFIDFGMTEGAKLWCKKHGTVLTVTKNPSLTPPKSATPYAQSKRQTWLSKPQALLSTPYQKTIWIDIDAMVKQTLAGLFLLCPEDAFALCPELSFRAEAEKETGLIPKQATSFNTGIIVYPSNAPLLHLWADAAKNTQALGDQDLLSCLIYEKELSIKQMPSIFNRIHPTLDDPDVVIYHYASQMGQSTLLQTLQIGDKR